MGIYSKKYWWCWCNFCGRIMGTYGSRNAAVKQAKSDGWEVTPRKLKCDDCIEANKKKVKAKS